MKIRLKAFMIFLSMLSFTTSWAGGRDFFIEISPLYFFYQGGGGSLGIESGRWQHGFAFSTFNPDGFIQDGKIDVRNSYTTLRAMNFEPYTRFYFSKERKWLYLGLNFSPEMYLLQSDTSGFQTISMNIFANPKIGLRWFPFKRIFYFDANYTLNIKIFDGETRTFGIPEDTFSKLVGRPEFAVGFRF